MGGRDAIFAPRQRGGGYVLSRLPTAFQYSRFLIHTDANAIPETFKVHGALGRTGFVLGRQEQCGYC